MAPVASRSNSPGAITASTYRAMQAASGGCSGPGATYRALGRLKPGDMNKTEARYDSILWSQRATGDVLWHAFEAVKFKLADNTFFTPDFAVLPADRVMEFHDVKGARHLIEEDARVKAKVAARLFPFRFFYALPRARRDGGGFEVVEVTA